MPIAITPPDLDSDIVNISPPSTQFDLVNQKSSINHNNKTDMSEIKIEVKSEKELQQRVDEAVQRVREQSDRYAVYVCELKPDSRLSRYRMRKRQEISLIVDRYYSYVLPSYAYTDNKTYLAIFVALSTVPVFCFVCVTKLYIR